MAAVQPSEMVDDLVGALRLVGFMEEGEAEAQAEVIVHDYQQRAGLIGSVRHHSDGYLPTNVFSVGVGG